MSLSYFTINPRQEEIKLTSGSEPQDPNQKYCAVCKLIGIGQKKMEVYLLISRFLQV